MTIIINQKSYEFHLFNNHISYIFRVLEKSKPLEHIYFGKKIIHRDTFKHLIEREPRISTNMFEWDYTSSLEHIKQEYPGFGTTDYRFPAHEMTNSIGSKITNFRYESYQIIQGKPSLKDLPATYTDSPGETETLEITLCDEVLGCKLVLNYSIYTDCSVICRNAKVVNESDRSFYLQNVMSTSIDFPDADYEMLIFPVHGHGKDILM